MRKAVYFCPGRINLIGEHIDYNGGLVIPAAIEKGIRISVSELSDFQIRLTSSLHTETWEGSIQSIPAAKQNHAWADYVLGVLYFLRETKGLNSGISVHFDSDLPQSSGLSSSAAIEVGTYFAMCDFFNLPNERSLIAQHCQQIENTYIGVKCGIMDQFAVAMGKEDNAILLNCDNLECQFIPLMLGDVSIVVMNTKVPRKLIHSKYNERKEECEKALKEIQVYKPGVTHLAACSVSDLKYISDTNLMKRARHVITEQWRVVESARVLELGDLQTFGRLLNASHQSLQNDYEVSGDALDAIVFAAQQMDSCMGARMTGAGFGGCAIALVRENDTEHFIKSVGEIYKSEMSYEAEFFVTKACDGVRLELN